MEFLASSKPNLIRLYNDQYGQSPYIEISLNGTPSDTTVTAKAMADEFELVITGSMDGKVTATSFNTRNDSNNNPILSLAEALKKNVALFYDVTVTKTNNVWKVKAYYDSSMNYTFSVGSGLSISGDYMGRYIPIVKYILNYKVNDGESQFDAEKHTNQESLTYNISNPFANTMGKFPVKFNLSGYKTYSTSSGIDRTMPLGDFAEDYIVMPTTCGQFYDLDYSKYFISRNTNKKGYFLTTATEREIGYDEYVAMSVICDDTVNLKMRAMYYTPSGQFISSFTEADLKQKGGYISETVNGRTDIYFNPCISEIETISGKVVGYCEIVVMNGTNEVSNRMRLRVNGRCKKLNTLYFINKIGGVDWYSFMGSVENEVSIDDNETYTSNYIAPYTHMTKHKTNVRYKTMEKMVTLNSDKISNAEALWLEELASSKYVFIRTNDKTYPFTEVVVDSCDIDTDSNEKYAEVSVTYYVGDKDIIR